MPLVVEHEIDLFYEGNGKWGASWDAKLDAPLPNYCIEIINENPQRALAECLLKVLVDKQEIDSE